MRVRNDEVFASRLSACIKLLTCFIRYNFSLLSSQEAHLSFYLNVSIFIKISFSSRKDWQEACFVSGTFLLI